ACSGPAMQVLFVGNSYTSVNDLPGMVSKLAASAGQRVEASTVAPGGWWWRDHAASAETMGAISSREWDFVVLQEQSMVPADPKLLLGSSLPAASQMTRAARNGGAEIVLFLTWGHRGGSREVSQASYSSMQIALADGYQLVSERLIADIAPVGMAWWMALEERPDINLFQADGSHPTLAGTYLAASVITGILLDVDPETFTESLGLYEPTAAALRGFASRAVDGEIPWKD
ncbi:MAG: hypothetical protein WCA93_12920, partial [Acidimicrobiia bacterium]